MKRRLDPDMMGDQLRAIADDLFRDQATIGLALRLNDLICDIGKAVHGAPAAPRAVPVLEPVTPWRREVMALVCDLQAAE